MKWLEEQRYNRFFRDKKFIYCIARDRRDYYNVTWKQIFKNESQIQKMVNKSKIYSSYY